MLFNFFQELVVKHQLLGPTIWRKHLADNFTLQSLHCMLLMYVKVLHKIPHTL